MRISDWSSDVCSSDLDDGAEKNEEIGDRISEEALFGLHRITLARAARADLDRQQHEHGRQDRRGPAIEQIGRASCRERVCQYVSISVVAVFLQKKQTKNMR